MFNQNIITILSGETTHFFQVMDVGFLQSFRVRSHDDDVLETEKV